MAYMALPDLKLPLARPRQVDDMLNLANVASILEEDCWEDPENGTELRMKNSQHLSLYGIAFAMNAHCRHCLEYNEAINPATE